jgi:AraC-like DNA-binding protein
VTRRTDDRQPPHHRNLTCYTNYGCRLPECADRYRQWNRNRLNAIKAGNWQPHVDAEPVRRHLRALGQHGISIRQAATLAGISPRSLHPLFYRPIRHTVRPDIAEAVLAIHPEQVTPTRIDATGTARRIQALVADGWPMKHLAEHLGVYHSYVHALVRRSEEGKPIRATTAAKVADAYNKLAGQRPIRHGINRRLVKQARSLAASRRWPPTSYWADRMDVIDDPHFQPEHGLTKREVIAREAHWLMQQGGLDREAAAERLGVHKSYIDHALREHPDTDLAA